MDDVLEAALAGVDGAHEEFTFESASEASSLSDDEGADPEWEEDFGPVVFGAPAANSLYRTFSTARSIRISSTLRGGGKIRLLQLLRSVMKTWTVYSKVQVSLRCSRLLPGQFEGHTHRIYRPK